MTVEHGAFYFRFVLLQIPVLKKENAAAKLTLFSPHLSATTNKMISKMTILGMCLLTQNQHSKQLWRQKYNEKELNNHRIHSHL